MSSVKLSCGNTVNLIQESRLKENLDDLLEMLSDIRGKNISCVSENTAYSASIKDINCYTNNSCSYQIYLNGRGYCFSPELVEHYKK